MESSSMVFSGVAATCSSCRWARFCTGRNGDGDGRGAAGKVSACAVPLRRGTHLFRQGDELKALFVVRSGSVKCYTDSEDGCEQTVAFHFPGDLLGFDGIGHGMYPSSVVALEPGASGNELMRAAAVQMIERQNHALLLGQKSAQARISAFLLGLSARYAARGCSRTEFNLSMSRQEIANYLAVAVETISRLFSDLQRRGVLDVDRRFVKILSLPRLQSMAHESRSAGVAAN